MFSRRTAWTVEPAPPQAPAPLDLTVSNPTEVDLLHPPELWHALVDERSARYAPDSLGLLSAREAVAAYYAARPGRPRVDPAHLGLCASTSEAYAYLLALLCDPGDAVLVPQPGYPLLRVLAELAGVELVPYPLLYEGTWSIDQDGLADALAASPRARAVVVVAPSNPCGNYLRAGELAQLDAISARGLAVVVDEVFWDYPLRDVPRPSPVDGARPGLWFVLSGLSKVAALPQLKLAWWLALGPRPVVAAALARLELIADTYLSAATPVQLAAGRLLAAAPAVQARISRRTAANLAALRRACEGTALTALTVDAGWLALVRLPAVHDLTDRDWAARLRARHGVQVQPGELYDLAGAPHLALSLLTPEATFAAALAPLRDVVAEVLACGPCSP